MAPKVNKRLLSLLFLLMATSASYSLGNTGSDVLSTYISYDQIDSILDYLYQPSLPELSELTCCFWLYNLTADWQQNTALFTISVQADFNELQVEIPTSLDDLVLLRAKLYSSPDTAYQYRDIWRERHKHCMVWAAGKQVQWFVDLSIPGLVEPFINKTVYGTDYTIRSGGYLILMHEQDAYGGGLDTIQATKATIADFNIWNYRMNLTELQSLPCNSTGNIVNMNTLTQRGPTGLSSIDLPCPTESESYSSSCSKSRPHVKFTLDPILRCSSSSRVILINSADSITTQSVESCAYICAVIITGGSNSDCKGFIYNSMWRECTLLREIEASPGTPQGRECYIIG